MDSGKSINAFEIKKLLDDLIIHCIISMQNECFF